jgi:ABC-type uncharacterized transport system substrate-binding protein
VVLIKTRAHSLPEIIAVRADGGGLMSYGPNFPDSFRRAVTHVDKILKGAKPADLPVEQPKKFEFHYQSESCRANRINNTVQCAARANKVIK